MSYILGIDIGTSKIALVVMDALSGKLLDCISMKSEADIPSQHGRFEQSPDKIMTSIVNAARSFKAEYRSGIKAIGVTGQIHGVVLWNRNETSPLYTWKDKRASENGFLDRIRKKAFCERLSEGFGNATLAFLAEYDDLEKWDCASTIHDYIVSEFAALKHPVSDPSDAASWGLFDIRSKQWNTEAVNSLKIPRRLLPDVIETGTPAGKLSCSYAEKLGLSADVTVYVAMGDNQASIMGTAQNRMQEIYLTLGTGAQLSVVIEKGDIDRIDWPSSVELRPFCGDDYLAVAAPLCGGQAFAWLIDSVHSWIEELAVPVPSKSELYDRILSLALSNMDSPLIVKPNFLGERHDAQLRGEISNIDMKNFSIGNLAAALARGIIDNMYSMMPSEVFAGRKLILASGNGVRRNPPVQEFIRERFALPMEISEQPEEAATGAALFCKG